jgi:hypothetical protein
MIAVQQECTKTNGCTSTPRIGKKHRHGLIYKQENKWPNVTTGRRDRATRYVAEYQLQCCRVIAAVFCRVIVE